MMFALIQHIRINYTIHFIIANQAVVHAWSISEMPDIAKSNWHYKEQNSS